MHPDYPSTPPSRPPTPHPTRDAAQSRAIETLRETDHRAQRAFLVVNGVPFAIGAVLSCFTDVPGVAVHGKLTLGLVWGTLQCALFVASAWWLEVRSTRTSDPVERSLASDALRTGGAQPAPVNGSWR
ncbi:hypothetical protein AB0M32_51620 [Streptomyces sp. NPDC051985]|uniref:hypothetical protein n=1 Tax=Streptomyces sp. NPDC051985 TaxID=3155807 RepID=UPI00341D3E94